MDCDTQLEQQQQQPVRPVADHCVATVEHTPTTTTTVETDSSGSSNGIECTCTHAFLYPLQDYLQSVFEDMDTTMFTETAATNNTTTTCHSDRCRLRGIQSSHMVAIDSSSSSSLQEHTTSKEEQLYKDTPMSAGVQLKILVCTAFSRSSPHCLVFNVTRRMHDGSTDVQKLSLPLWNTSSGYNVFAPRPAAEFCIDVRSELDACMDCEWVHIGAGLHLHICTGGSTMRPTRRIVQRNATNRPYIDVQLGTSYELHWHVSSGADVVASHVEMEMNAAPGFIQHARAEAKTRVCARLVSYSELDVHVPTL
jgi:hypothetical protein